MKKYYNCWQPHLPATASLIPENESPSATKTRTLLSDYDQYWQTLIDKNDNEEWSSELQHYKNSYPVDVTKDTDIVQWWQVCSFFLPDLEGPFLI